jgi:ferredoxin
MKVNRKIIEIDEELCDGCGQCIMSCAEGALEIVDGKAKVISDEFCDGLGACLSECPMGALKIIEREAPEFDEEAVEKHLAETKKTAPEKQEQTLPCGCPSSHIQQFAPSKAVKTEELFLSPETSVSGLSHWPVKIRLVPPNAPFLNNADLLVVADCVPAAHPSFHRDLLKEKAMLMGCPKFDDVQEYIDKFTRIFRHSDIRSITAVMMEVPCCAGIPMIVKKAMEAAKVDIPMQEIVISTRGKAMAQRSATSCH